MELHLDRKTYLGASEIACALGLGTYEDPTAVWAKKTGRRGETPPSADMKRGTFLEPIVRNGCLPEDPRVLDVFEPRDFHRDPEFAHIGAHDDGSIMMAGFDGVGALEIKCPNRFTFERIKEDGLPNENVLQLTYVMGLAGDRWGAFAVHSADHWETLLFEVDLDTELFGWLRTQGDIWWRKFVEGDTPPPNPVEATIPEIPKIRGEATFNDSEEWSEAMVDWLQYRETKKELERIWDGEAEGGEDGLQKRILAMMGDNKTVIGGGWKVHQVVSEGRLTFSAELLEQLGPLDPQLVANVLNDVLGQEINDSGSLEWKIMDRLKLETRIRADDPRLYKQGEPFRYPRAYAVRG